MVSRQEKQRSADGSNLPLITIGITCYNAEGTIRRAVESALAQTWPESEIIVVDDGSSDRSQGVLRELERAHSEVRTIAHDANCGVACARNTVLAHARGDYIAFFDDDDESVPHRLERQYRRILGYKASSSKAVVLCYSNRDVHCAGTARARRPSLGIGRIAPEPSGSIVADYVLGLIRDDGRHSWGMLGCGTLMARTEELRRLGGFDVRFHRCEELDLAVRAAHQGAHFISVDAPLITQHLTATPAVGIDTQLKYQLLMLEKYKPYLRRRRAYLGAQCNMRAQSGRRHHWWWRLWYLAALVCFPWSIARERLGSSTFLARAGLLPTRATPLRQHQVRRHDPGNCRTPRT